METAKSKIFVTSIIALATMAFLGWTVFSLLYDNGPINISSLFNVGIAVALAFAVAATLRFAFAPILAAPALAASSPGAAAPDADGILRSRIAPIVVIAGSVAILMLALVLIYAFHVASQENNEIHQQYGTLLNGIFTAVLPVFATWVGTVIAFYFSNESYKVANEAVRDATAGMVDKLRRTAVKTAMIPLARTVAHRLDPAQPLGGAPLGKIKASFDGLGDNGQPLSRLLILDSSDRYVAILHRSSWTELCYAGSQGDAPVDMTTGTLDKLIGRSIVGVTPARTYEDFLTKSAAFVAANKTLADAKAAMESLSGCQDVIVTETGAQTAPVVGWIMNTDIARYAQP